MRFRYSVVTFLENIASARLKLWYLLQEAQRAKKEAAKATKQAQIPKKPQDDNAEPNQNKKQSQNQQKLAQANQEKQSPKKHPFSSNKQQQQQQQNTKKVRFPGTEGASEVPQEDKKPTQTGSSQRWTLGVMRMDDPAHIKKSLRQLSKKKLPPRPFEPARISYFQHLSQPDKRINVLDQHQYVNMVSFFQYNFPPYGVSLSLIYF